MAAPLTPQAQTNALTYSFHFSKKDGPDITKGVYVMADNSSPNAAIVFQDNDHADYLLVDSNFKLISKFSLVGGQTLFNYDPNIDDKLHYVGATSNGPNYTFIYRYGTPANGIYGYRMETVYFNSKSVVQKQLLKVPSTEVIVAEVSDHNNFYLFTAVDAYSSIKVYRLSGDGTLKEKQIRLPDGIKGLDLAVKNVKIFPSKDVITLLFTNGNNLLNVSINSFDLSATSHQADFPAAEDGKNYVADLFLLDNKIFLLHKSAKNIGLLLTMEDGKPLAETIIDENNYDQIAGSTGTYVEISNNKLKDKSVDGFNAMKKALEKGNAIITVEKTRSNQYLVSIGSYNGTSETGSGTSFRFLLDAKSLKPIKGNPPLTTEMQMLTRTAEVNHKMYNQFEFHNKGYIGYFDNAEEVYHFQSIPIKK